MDRLRNSWHNLPIGHKGLVVLAIPVVPMLAMLMWFARLPGTLDNSQRVAHTEHVRFQARALSTALLRAVAITREHLFDDDRSEYPRFLQRREETAAAALALQQLVEDNPAQCARVRRMRPVVSAELDLLTTEWTTTDPAAGRKSIGRSSAMVDGFMRELDEFLSEETRLLSKQSARVLAERETIARMIWVAAGWGLIGPVFAIILFSRGVVFRLKGVERDADFLARGLPLPPAREGCDEISSLDRGLHWAATTIEERERHLNEAKLRAETATAAKSDFLATMSHEIRTPMHVIMGMIDLISETPLSQEQAGYLHLLRKSSKNLLTLINDILDLSKVEAGQIVIEESFFRLDEMINRTAELMAPRAHQKGLELSVLIAHDTPNHLVGDSDRLRQVLLNLASNAIKFTSAGEVIVGVEATRLDFKDVMLSFSVSDTGIGIPSHQLEMIFERFTQADSSTTRCHGGTGLGLAISKQIVELMGGSLRVNSTVGKGSTFSFSVPLRINAETAPERVTVPAELAGLQTLIVDDNATNRLILRRALAPLGVSIEEAQNGFEALAKLRRAHALGLPYDLLLVDCRMPGMDGFEMVRQAAQAPGSHGATVVMLTSDDRAGGLQRCRELGIDAYLVKPIHKDALVAAICKTVGRAQPRDEVMRSPATPSNSVPRRRILLAEDSEDNVFLMRAYIGASHELDVAENGAVAVEKFKAGQYDIVFMDVQMPVLEGYAAARKIRSWEENNHRNPTPIIAFTAHAMKDEKLKSAEAGCNAHFSKPITKATVLSVIAEFTSGSKGYGEIADEIRAMAPAFIARQSSKLQSLGTALADHDYSAIRQYAHNLKGTGQGYGYAGLSELARNLEDAAKAEDAQSVAKHMTALDAALEEASQ